MPLRGSHRRVRLVRLRGPRASATAAVLALILGLGSAPGCVASRTAARGSYYTVKPGENLYRIGLRTGVPHEVIARTNRIQDVTDVRPGTRLWIPAERPGRKSPLPRPPASAPPARAKAPPPARIPPPSAQVGRLSMAWPLRGRVTSGFGHRRGRPHEGIDIAGRRGSPIRAAAPGKVIFAGWLGGYGKVVIVRHAHGLRSVYAHASQIRVRKGQSVARGQHIADVGTTGRSTGPHLHFEVRRGETPVNPLRYLR